jgi:hypothetical protein
MEKFTYGWATDPLVPLNGVFVQVLSSAENCRVIGSPAGAPDRAPRRFVGQPLTTHPHEELVEYSAIPVLNIKCAGSATWATEWEAAYGVNVLTGPHGPSPGSCVTVHAPLSGTWSRLKWKVPSEPLVAQYAVSWT